MHELKEKMKPLSEMKEKLVKWANSEMEHGKESVDTKEMGEVIDMIKDLAEAEEKCYKAKYYEYICCAMAEAEEGGEEGPYGYDRYRYPSSGRFAPKGSGKRYGYIPPYMTMPDDDPFVDMIRTFDPTEDYRMGYAGGSTGSQGGSRSGGSRGGSSSGSMGYDDPRYGEAYNRFRNSRKGYSETHSSEDKSETNESAKEHMTDTVETLRDIWASADPELKKMKSDLGSLMNELS